MTSVGYSNVKAIVMDIEGTMTSISFVKETLYPYVRSHLSEHLTKNWESPLLREDIRMLKKQFDLDKEAGVEGLVPIENDDKESLEKNILWQMDLDRKTTSLKQLQGHILEDGYNKGEIKGHLYPEVPFTLKQWAASGRRLFTYSSGSLYTQKLLFANTARGILLDLIDGYYDTTTGPKQEPKSYEAIATDIDCPAEQILFLTDVFAEAEAAKTAGFHAVLVQRDGNPPLPEGARAAFTVITSFDQLELEPCTKRAKKDIEPVAEQENDIANEAMEVETIKDDTENKTESTGDAEVTSSEDPIAVNGAENGKEELVDPLEDPKPTEEIKEQPKEEAVVAVEENPAETDSPAKQKEADESNEVTTTGEEIKVVEEKAQPVADTTEEPKAKDGKKDAELEKEETKTVEEKKSEVADKREAADDAGAVTNETEKVVSDSETGEEIKNGAVNGAEADAENHTNGTGTNGAAENGKEEVPQPNDTESNKEEIAVKKVAEATAAPVDVAVSAE